MKNCFTLSKSSYEERIEWANTEGFALADQIATNPESTVENDGTDLH